MNESVHIGKAKVKKVLVEKPKKKYRIIVQEKQIRGNGNEGCRSFMIFDFTGKSKIDKIKKQLMQVKLK